MGKMFTEKEVRSMIRNARKEIRKEIESGRKKRVSLTTESMLAVLNTSGTILEAAVRLGVTVPTLNTHMRKNGIAKQFVVLG
jgi:hypothetical protein